MKKNSKIKKYWWWIGAILLLSLGVFFWLQGRAPQTEYSTLTVRRGELVQTVSETGTVKPLKQLVLNFPQSGRINAIMVKVGDRVLKDQILAELDEESLIIREEEAQAGLAVALANRAKLTSGATVSEIAVLEAQVRQAKAAYDGAANDYNKIRNSVSESTAQAEKTLHDLTDESSQTPTAAEQAVTMAKLNLSSGLANYQQALNNSRNVFMNTAEYNIAVANSAIDKIRGLLEDSDLKEVYSVKNTSYKTASELQYQVARDERLVAEGALATAKQNVSSDANTLNSQISFYLNKIFIALNTVYSGLENSITSANFSMSRLDAYKTSINSQISAINAAISSQQLAKHNFDTATLAYANNSSSLNEAVRQAEINLYEARLAASNALNSARLNGERQISAAKSSMDSARESWGVAERQLSKLKAGPRSEDLSLAEAQIQQAQANLNLIQKQKADSRLKAPMDGQITSVNYEVGEQFNASKPMLSMLSESNFEIEVDISETDIAKIKIGDMASATFDALGERYKFTGQVYAIEPGATIIQGVIYYKVRIALLEPEAGDAQADYFSLIKPDMTANVLIFTDKREDALIIPNRAVVDLNNGQSKFVRILAGQEVREVPVSLGLSADEGLVEVLSGDLVPGQEVITFIREVSR